MNEPELEKKDIALGDAEIASIIEASKKASYQKSQKVPVRDTVNFTARKLVDIAFEAEERRRSNSDDSLEKMVQDTDDSSSSNEEKVSTIGEEVNASPDVNTVGNEEVTKLNEKIKILEDELSNIQESTELKVKLADENGYNRGLSEGMTKTEQKLRDELNKKIETFESIISSFTERSGIDTSKLNDTIDGAIKRIAEHRVQIEIASNPNIITNRIQKLSKMIINVSEKPKIRLSSADFNLVHNLIDSDDVGYILVEDRSLVSGDAVLEAGNIELRDLLEEKVQSNPLMIETRDNHLSNEATSPEVNTDEPKEADTATSSEAASPEVNTEDK